MTAYQEFYHIIFSCLWNTFFPAQPFWLMNFCNISIISWLTLAFIFYNYSFFKFETSYYYFLPLYHY